MDRRAVHAREARGDLDGADGIGHGEVPHRHHHAAMQAAGGHGVEPGAVGADLLALLDVPDRHAGFEQCRLERIGAAKREGDEVVAPQRADIGLLRHCLAVTEHPVARQVAAHVDIGTEARQGRVARRALRDQRTGLGVRRAEHCELVGPVGRQDHEVGLQMARRHARGHGSVVAGSNAFSQKFGGTDRRETGWRVHLRPPTDFRHLKRSRLHERM